MVPRADILCDIIYNMIHISRTSSWNITMTYSRIGTATARPPHLVLLHLRYAPKL